jgi:pimeloyl-ACP methyl ester carboxylesterase
MERFIDYWSGEGAWASLSAAKREQFAALAAHVAHHFWSLINEDTLLAAYAAVDVPTLILCGTHSPKPSRAITRLLADALPRARHRTIRGGNHMSAITHAAKVNPIILEHVLTNAAQDRMPRIDAPRLQPADENSLPLASTGQRCHWHPERAGERRDTSAF